MMTSKICSSNTVAVSFCLRASLTVYLHYSTQPQTYQHQFRLSLKPCCSLPSVCHLLCPIHLHINYQRTIPYNLHIRDTLLREASGIQHSPVEWTPIRNIVWLGLHFNIPRQIISDSLTSIGWKMMHHFSSYGNGSSRRRQLIGLEWSGRSVDRGPFHCRAGR